MHYKLLLAITLPVAQILSSESSQIPTTKQPVYIHNTFIENSNPHHSSHHFSHQAYFTQQGSFSNSIDNIQHFAQSARDHTKEYAYGILSWIHQNKAKTALSGALIGYGYIWYKLVSLNYALAQNINWSKWHDTVTLEELLARPQQELATDLLTAIQRQYTTPDKFDDVISPLVSFVQDVDTEINELHQIVQLHTWIDRLRISFLFPKQTLLVSQAQEKIHRLTYLKNLLLQWVSQNKVARLTTR